MSGFPREVILASAGTGKTFQLSRRYRELLRAGVPPERILATTFTRKAAGEILDRILEDLAREAVDQAGRALLARSLRALDRFEVRTLDSFFAGLGRLFAPELGLPPDWRILDEVEDAELRSEALAAQLEQEDADDLLRLLDALEGGRPNRSVHESLLRTLDAALELYRDSPPEAWEQPSAPPDPAVVAAARAELAEFEPPRTKKGKPDQRWLKVLTHLQETDPEEEALLANGLVKKVLAGEELYWNHPVPEPLIRRLLAPLAHRLKSEAAARTRAARRLLAGFDDHYARAKARRRGYRFEDLPRALAGAEGRAALGPLLAHRAGAPIEHLLLDEFQDTSVIQWRVLQPLAERVLAAPPERSSFFCVGDLKQSIYGWRSGEPRLLAAMAERYRDSGVVPEELHRSWRSAPEVLELVNALFPAIPGVKKLADAPELAAAAARWAGAFPLHESARPELRGSARVLQAPAAEDDESQEPVTLRCAAERAAALACEGLEVGLLVRRGRFVAPLLHELQRLGVRASGEGGNPLTDSGAVLAALALLWLADHPGDTAAAFHVARAGLDARLGFGPEAPRELAAAVRTRLATEGYGPFLAELAPVFADASAWDRVRFRQLVERAYAQDRAGGPPRPAAFVRAVRAEKVPSPLRAPVQVMTIHAAKGLGFDAVVVTDLAGKLFARPASFVRSRPDPAGPLERVLVQPGAALEGLDPEGAGALAAGERARTFEEALCVLYVALTRAKERLEVVLPPLKRQDLSLALLLRQALGLPEDGADVLWSSGERPGTAAAAARKTPTPAAAPAPAPVPLRLLPPARPRLLPRETPSGAEGGPLRRGRELLRIGGRAARARGILVHRLCEEVEWLEDFRPDRPALLALVAGHGLAPAAAAEAVDGFLAALAAPEIRAALSRAGQPDEPREVWRERRFQLVVPDEAGRPQLRSGSFDRVVLFAGGGGEVLDFKTDAVDESGAAGRPLAELVELYRPQLELYRDSLSRLAGIPRARIGARLLFLRAGRAVVLAPPG
ncbi:MAG: hypothetical protein D6702_07460 [Planctomycetota bacterium]|nr:MAG: hypothetical protein D6702_07460 [Planctomycetota bacterium]